MTYLTARGQNRVSQKMTEKKTDNLLDLLLSYTPKEDVKKDIRFMFDTGKKYSTKFLVGKEKYEFYGIPMTMIKHSKLIKTMIKTSSVELVRTSNSSTTVGSSNVELVLMPDTPVSDKLNELTLVWLYISGMHYCISVEMSLEPLSLEQAEEKMKSQLVLWDFTKYFDLKRIDRSLFSGFFNIIHCFIHQLNAAGNFVINHKNIKAGFSDATTLALRDVHEKFKTMFSKPSAVNGVELDIYNYMRLVLGEIDNQEFTNTQYTSIKTPYNYPTAEELKKIRQEEQEAKEFKDMCLKAWQACGPGEYSIVHELYYPTIYPQAKTWQENLEMFARSNPELFCGAIVNRVPMGGYTEHVPCYDYGKFPIAPRLVKRERERLKRNK